MKVTLSKKDIEQSVEQYVASRLQKQWGLRNVATFESWIETGECVVSVTTEPSSYMPSSPTNVLGEKHK